MGEKPLVWQHVLAVFLLLGMLPAAIFAWGGDIPAEYRPRGAIAFWCLLALFVWLVVWGFLRSRRADIHADVLARLFPEGTIMQIGPMHLWLNVLVLGPRVRAIAVVQNTRNGDGELRLVLRPERSRAFRLASGGGVFAEDVPPLVCAVPGSGFVVASCDLMLMPPESSTQVKLWLEGSARGSGGEVRFAKRRAVTKRVSGAMTVLALLGGAIVFGGGTSLSIEVRPFPRVMPPQPANRPRGWQVRPVSWTTADRAEAAIVQMLNQVVPSPASQPPLY